MGLWTGSKAATIDPNNPETAAADEAVVNADKSLASASSEPSHRVVGRGADSPGDVFASSLVVVVVGLALGLVAWAPWREERPPLSDYGARIEAGGSFASALAITSTQGPPVVATPTIAVSPIPSAAAAAAPTRVAEPPRPLGVPIKRTDWLILRDYVAHGGPSPTGAIDIGIVGNREAVGTPVYATQDGTVRVLRGNRLYGNLVAVKNGRWSTTYGHLDQVLVREGQAVRRGDQLGTLGQSGQATVPQLDYQVWEQVGADELNRNPLDFLASR